jgi:uncharacterized protein HemX
MSTTAKAIIVLVILIILGGVYYWYVQSQAGTPTSATSATTATPASPDTSDGALVQDTAAIDAQMTNLNADNTSMNASDQPVTQSY